MYVGGELSYVTIGQNLPVIKDKYGGPALSSIFKEVILKSN